VQPNGINVGVVMARSGTIFPDAVGAPEQLYSPGWGLIHNVSDQDLDRDLQKAGWSFFFMAGSIQASVLGRRSERSTRNAMRRVLAKSNRSSFNCLEVTRTIHPNHIRHSLYPYYRPFPACAEHFLP